MKARTSLWFTGLLTAVGIAGAARGEWMIPPGASSGTTDDAAHRYTNTDNWEGGVIDDVISTNYPMTGNFTLYFGEDRTTTANGIEIRVGSYQGTYRGSGGNRTLTLMGDFRFLQGGNTTWGSASLPSPVPADWILIDLGGGVRTFNIVPGASSFSLWCPIVGTGDIVKTGAGSVSMFSSESTFNGRMTVNQGMVSLASGVYSGNKLFSRGKLPNVQGVTIDATAVAATFGISSKGSEVFNDAASIKLRSGAAQATFAHARDSVLGTRTMYETEVEINDVVETMDDLILDTGLSLIQQGVALATDTNFALRLNSPALVRNNRSAAWVRSFMTTSNNRNVPSIGLRGEDISSGDGLAGNQIFFTQAPSTVGGIVPYLLGGDMVFAGTINSFVTYNGTDGLRVLRTATDAYGNAAELVSTIAAAGSTDNVRISVAEPVSADKTVNALFLNNVAATLGAGVTLTLGSGCLALRGGAGDVFSDVTGVLDFGANEAIVHVVSGDPEIQAGISGSGGLTVAGSPVATVGNLFLHGVNTYTGQTTVLGGSLMARNFWAGNLNTSLPDTGTVLLHPSATLRIGHERQDFSRTEEIIGGLAGAGNVRLGNVTGTEANRGKLLIGGALEDGATGEITLAGGTLAPGMPGETGTLSFTTEVRSPSPAIPVVLKNGTLNIDLFGPDDHDRISILGTCTISAGGSLAIDVNVQGFTPTAGQEWTILTASAVTDGNSGTLFDTVADNSDRINFTTEIKDGNQVVLTAVSAAVPGTVILLW